MLSGDALEDALDPPPLGDGAVALFSRGRDGQRAPASLAELLFDDAEQLLNSAVNDSDARPAPPASSGVPVPKQGLGDFFSFEFASDEDVAREAVADWLAAASVFESDVRGRVAAVRSYARSLGGTLSPREVPDPLASGLSADAAWLLVRSHALQRASTSTEVTDFGVGCGSLSRLYAKAKRVTWRRAAFHRRHTSIVCFLKETPGISWASNPSCSLCGSVGMRRRSRTRCFQRRSRLIALGWFGL